MSAGPGRDQTRETGHGRKETRTVNAVTIKTPGGLSFPHAQQAVRISRTRTIKGKTTRETAFLTVSLPAEQAQLADLSTWARSEWHIENRLHLSPRCHSRRRRSSGPDRQRPRRVRHAT